MIVETLPSSSGAWLRRVLSEASGRDRADRKDFLVETYVATCQGEPELGYIGRTWVSRGAGYWVRRSAATFAYFLLGVFIGTLCLGLGPDLLFNRQYSFNTHLPLTLKILILVVWYAPAVVAYLGMYHRLVLCGFSRDRFSQGPHLGSLTGRVLIPLALPFLSVAGGLVLAMFTSTLRADFPGEAVAREARRRYRKHQDAVDAQRREAKARGRTKTRPHR
ncbi:hypothetical protein GCM10023322_53370 [Rugosimonospora acidiphila]|uniref:RDD family protein n=1 Tax=Rugosimonospora acidiphila TaxID=556531 RepID=A0ABP9SAE8_9ACTN